MDPADGKLHKSSNETFKKIWTGVLVLLLPEEGFIAGNKKTSNTTRFWQLIQPHRAMMLQAIFGALVYTILGLATSIYVQKNCGLRLSRRQYPVTQLIKYYHDRAAFFSISAGGN